MDKNIFLKKFGSIFEEPPGQEITLESNFREIDTWSSMTALNLMVLADDEYNVNLTGDEIKSAITVENIFHIIENKADNQ
jgi:acyl carrier protein